MTTKVAFIIPTYHRLKSVLRQIQSFKDAKKTDDSIEYRFFYFMQDASEEDKAILDEQFGGDEQFNFWHRPKYDNPVIGRIRAHALDKAWILMENQNWCPDICYFVDDDIWFADNIFHLDRSIIDFEGSEFEMAFVRSFKNRNYKIVELCDRSSHNNTAPATDLGIMVKVSEKMFWLFDKTFRQLTVGEDCYLLFKGMAMGWKVGQVTGTGGSFFWDENWLMDTASNGGGIHEVTVAKLGYSPKDMVTRNELLSRPDKSYVQWHCADMFHYDSADSSFRRIRPNIQEYLKEYCLATEDHIVRAPGAGVMKFDGTNRTVFGLNKDYSYLTDLNDKWLSWASANSLL